ncbi:Uma2 family endonuclease [Methyloprofundus sp.]|uniref:Uma2 family endonuclease n=1 Tax=Methyloprofundus sp. TaxID=2020875 RepID=UPI003D0E905C
MQWQDVLADKSLQDLPYKIELNERGKIEMSPVSLIHSRLQGKLAKILGTELGGEIFTELAIETRLGVKVPDVAWGTEEYFQQHCEEVCATSAPEICIEILSPSNTMVEMQDKILLYLEAGAVEVWLVEQQGMIRFFNRDGEQKNSLFTTKITKIS